MTTAERYTICRACETRTPTPWGHHRCGALPEPNSKRDASRRRVFIRQLVRDPFAACPLGKWAAERERMVVAAPPGGGQPWPAEGDPVRALLTPELLAVIEHNRGVCAGGCERYVGQVCSELVQGTCWSQYRLVLRTGEGCPEPERAARMKQPTNGGQ